MTSRIDRLPPHDKEAEEAVLGSVLVDPEAWGKVCGYLNLSTGTDRMKMLVKSGRDGLGHPTAWQGKG